MLDSLGRPRVFGRVFGSTAGEPPRSAATTIIAETAHAAVRAIVPRSGSLPWKHRGVRALPISESDDVLEPGGGRGCLGLLPSNGWTRPDGSSVWSAGPPIAVLTTLGRRFR